MWVLWHFLGSGTFLVRKIFKEVRIQLFLGAADEEGTWNWELGFGERGVGRGVRDGTWDVGRGTGRWDKD